MNWRVPSTAKQRVTPLRPRVSVKFFLEQPDRVDQKAFIPVFHRWIQNDVLGTLLVDVADYTHVHHGPGVVLVGHEGLYSTDEADGRRGLQFAQRRSIPGTLAAQIRHALGKAVEACVQLEREENLNGTIRFRTNEVFLCVTDRLAAPDHDSLCRLKQDVAATFATLYSEAPLRVERDAQQSLFALRVSTTEPLPLRTLSDRIRGVPALRP